MIAQPNLIQPSSYQGRIRPFSRRVPLLVGALLLGTSLAAAQTYSPGDSVLAAVPGPGKSVFLGGQFDYISENHGQFVALNPTSGERSASFPRVAGSVLAIEPDGNGGFYIGGDFERVGTSTSSGLAHIRSDGSVNTAFLPSLNGDVYSMHFDSATSRLFIGGNFSLIDGQSRQSIASFDLNTFALDSWAPTTNAQVYAIERVGSAILIGGTFSTVNGQARLRAASLNPTTGVLFLWNPAPNGTVYSFANVPDETAFLVGGSFTEIGGSPRVGVAAFNTTLFFLLADTFDLNQFGDIRAMETSGSTVYIGGYFDTVDGSDRSSLAALNIDTMTVTDFAPMVNGDVSSLAIADGVLFVGGGFTSVGVASRLGLASFSIANGALQSFDPRPSGLVYAVQASGGQIGVGGIFSGVGQATVTRDAIAQVNVDTGKPYDWDAQFYGAVYALAWWNGKLVAGGYLYPDDFAASGEHLFLVDPNTGVIEALPKPNDGVFSIVIKGNKAYIGGRFTAVDGQPRNRMAAINLKTKQLDSTFTPAFNSSIEKFAFSGGKLYVAGLFSEVNGQAQSNLAVIDPNTGALVSGFNPNVNQPIATFVPAGQRMFIGGYFQALDNVPDTGYLALVERSSGAVVSSFAPGLEYLVNAIGLINDRVYVGGAFSAVGGTSHSNFAVLRRSDGLLLESELDADASPDGFLAWQGRALAYGDFDRIGNTGVKGFANLHSVNTGRLTHPTISQSGQSVRITCPAGAGAGNYVVDVKRRGGDGARGLVLTGEKRNFRTRLEKGVYNIRCEAQSHRGRYYKSKAKRIVVR